MAEPARENPVYDPEDERFLSAQERAERRWGLKPSGDDTKSESGVEEVTKPSARERANQAWGMSPEEVKDAEESVKPGAPENKDSAEQASLFRNEGKANKPKSGSKLKKRLLIGGGVAGAGAAISMVFFFAALPFKMVTIVENLQSHFYALPQNAVNKYSDTIFGNYVKKYIMPGLKGTCTNTKVDAGCVAVPPGTNPITKLYRGWADNHFEQKLAVDYGLVISREGSNYYMRVPGLSLFNQDSKGFDITGFDKQNKDLFDYIAGDPNNQKIKVSQVELRQRVRDAMEGETKSTRLLYRFKLGRFLERKYGLPRCVVACKTRDSWGDWKNNKKLAFKTALVQRIVEPHGEVSATILNCLISGGCEQSKSVDTDGKGNGAAEKQINGILDKTLQKIGVESTEDAIKAANDIAEKGGQKWLIGKLLTQMGVSEGEDLAANTVDGIGWVAKIVSILKAAREAGPVIKRLAYVSMTADMVRLWMTYRSHVDEIKAGQVTEDFVGSFNDGLNGIQEDSNGNSFEPPGGAENAENSPLYNALLGSQSGGTTFNNLLTSKVFAQAPAQHNPNYTCDNGQPIATGQLVCPEEKVSVNDAFTNVSDFLNQTPVIRQMTGGIIAVWDSTIGSIYKHFQEVLSKSVDLALNIPLVKQAVSELTTPLAGLVQTVIQGITSYIIPSPISTGMSGARVFDMMAGGADASASDYAHYSLGGQQLSPAQTAAIQNDELQSQQAEFAMMPLSQRLFDSNNTNSLISQVAMALPSNLGMGAQSFAASLISNPFSKLFSGFGSLLAGQKAHAMPQDDPFGIVHFGYPLDDPVFSTDPETYTDEYCKKYDNWITEAHDNGDGQFVNDQTNPCLLQKAATEGLGGLYDSSLIPSQDM